MPVLTDARLAVWKAIDNYAPLAGVFKQRLKCESEEDFTEDMEPSISDMPAILIAPASNTPDWFTNRVQNWIYVLDLTLWTPGWVVSTAEALLENALLALWRSRPGSAGVPYLELYMPFQTMGTAAMQLSRLSDAEGEGTKTLITRIQLALTIRKDPFGNL